MRVRGPKILARRYVRPERVGAIFVPDAWRTDGSRALWEVVESTPAADKLLMISLLPDWILVTGRNSGVYLERRDGHDIFVLAASSIVRIIPWTTEEHMQVKGKRVIVAPDAEKERVGAIIVAPGPAWERRPVTGTITEVGDEVNDDDIKVGARVLYPIHAGTEMTVNGAKRLVMEAAQLLAVLGDEEISHTLG